VVPIHQRDPEDVLPAPGSPAGTNAETADTLPRSMVTALESVDADERESAAEDLEDHQGADASAAIERLVKTDPSENVRYEAIRAGKKRKTAADVRIAIWALRNDGSSKVRVQACKTLEEIGDTAALRPLCRALLHDSDPAVRKAAAETIGNFEDRSALEALIYQESHESDERVLDEIRSAIDDLE
jgi:HEAT repeat protein